MHKMTDSNSTIQHEVELETEFGGYTILPDRTKQVLPKTKRKLPHWLAEPDSVDSNIKQSKRSIDEIGSLDSKSRESLQRNEITHLFPVQWQVIPEILDSVLPGSLFTRNGLPPRDICCSAPTGSGKTLAFVLPIVQTLRCVVTRQIRALVVLPVTELAVQVYKVFQTYCSRTNLRVGLAAGRSSFETEQAEIVYKGPGLSTSNVDILVCTPGRLSEHITHTDGFNLSQLRFLILDEVDRTLEEVKHDWLRSVESAVYSVRGKPGPLTANNAHKRVLPLQKLLFSATLTENPEILEQLHLCQPRLFTSYSKKKKSKEAKQYEPEQKKKKHDETLEEINSSLNKLVVKNKESSVEQIAGRYTTPPGLKEFYAISNKEAHKPLILLHLLHTINLRHVLVFSNSKETANRLYLLLKQYGGGLTIEYISSDLDKRKRATVLKSLSQNKVNVILSTDLMTRGLDSCNIENVISYDCPHILETYIHRVGRTARAGRAGSAYTIVNRTELSMFKKLMGTAKKKPKSLNVTSSQLKRHQERCQTALKQIENDL